MRVQSDDIATILDVCLERMRLGESSEACLLDYPSQAEELAPLLIAAMYARAFQPPRLAPEARRAIQRRLRQAVAERQPAPRPTPASWFRLAIVRFALALVIALLSMGGGVAAAQTSLPGSPLYPIKRAGERVRLAVALTPAQRAALHLDFAAARGAEILALANGQQAINSSLVADLDREYSLAREEFGRAPSADANSLATRYVSARQSDVAMLSALLARGGAVGRPQIERALRASQQALVGIEPAKPPAHPAPSSPTAESAPDHGANIPTTPDTKPDHGGPATPTGPGDAQPGGAPRPGGGPTGGDQGGHGAPAAPQPSPTGKPADAGSGQPSDSPGQGNGKPADPGSGQPPDTPPGQDTGKPSDSPGQGNGKPADPGSGQPPDTPPGQDNKPSDSPGQGSGKPADPGSGQPPDTPPGQDNKPADTGSSQSNDSSNGQGNGNNNGRGGRP